MTKNPTQKQKNILLIFSDQHRYDAMGCAGNPDIHTPNLDWLAENGTLYENVWCQSPFCQPSRTSFITGLYPHQTGFCELASLNNPPTLMKKLQKAGYETATFGKMHYTEIANLKKMAGKQQFHTAEFDDYFKGFGWDFLLQEFDKYHHISNGVSTPYLDYLDTHGLKNGYKTQIREHMRGTPHHWKASVAPFTKEHDLTTYLTNQALSWMDNRESEKPFFMKLAYVQPHPPLIADQEWSRYYEGKDIALPNFERIKSNNPIWRKHIEFLESHAQIKTMKKANHRAAIKEYYAMISLIDEQIGKVIEHLKSNQVLEDTIIIYTGDHGEMMGEHRLWGKMNFYPGSVQVPLIIGNNHSLNSANNNFFELIDLHKSILDYSKNKDREAPITLSRSSTSPVCSELNHFISTSDGEHRITLYKENKTICEISKMDKSTNTWERLDVTNRSKKTCEHLVQFAIDKTRSLI